MDEPGNIDLVNRPRVKTPQGTATIRSMSFTEDGRVILVPTVSPDGRIMSPREAIDHYHRTGQFLGKFDSVKAANAAAERLHQEQERMIMPDRRLDLLSRVAPPPLRPQTDQTRGYPGQ